MASLAWVEGDTAEVVSDGHDLDRAGLGSSVPGLGSGVGDGHLWPRQVRDLLVSEGLVGFDHRDVVGLLGAHEPAQVVLDRVQGIEGDQIPDQVQVAQQGPKVTGLVGFGAHLGLGEGDGAVVGDSGKQVAAALPQAG